MGDNTNMIKKQAGMKGKLAWSTLSENDTDDLKIGSR